MSQSSGGGRRRHFRIPAPTSLLSHRAYRAVDLSESGIQLRSMEPVSSGTSIRLTLNLDEESVDVEGIVRWCNENPSAFEDDYAVGVEFLKVGPTDLVKLRRYMEARTPGS